MAEIPDSEAPRRIYRKSGETVVRHIAGETILVPVRGNLADMQRIFSLNPVASFLWGRIDGVQDLGQMIEGVVDNFEVSPEDAEKDILEFISELKKAGLIEQTAY